MIIFAIFLFLETAIVDKHTVPKPTVGDVSGCHFAFVGVYRPVLLHILLFLLFLFCFWFLLQRHGGRLLLLIRLGVEITEQKVEHDGVHTDPPDECFRIITFDEKKLERVDYYKDELNHLHGSQIFLPPEVALHFWSKSGQKVIGVHPDVHECVEQAEERAVAACKRKLGHNRVTNFERVEKFFLRH